MIDGIMQYDLDNVYLFGWTIGQYPKVENDTGSFVNSFNFCNYNEGYSEADLDTFKDDIAQQTGVIHTGMGFWIQNLNQLIQHQILFGKFMGQ